MKAIRYAERIRLGEDVPRVGQTEVMKRISQFEKPETFCMPFSKKSMPDTIRVAVLNAEHGYNWYFDSQRRIGIRVALFCELNVQDMNIDL